MPSVLHAQQQRLRLRRAPRGRAATAVAIAVAALALLSPAAAVKGVSPWSSGLITHYGGSQDGEMGGSVWEGGGRFWSWAPGRRDHRMRLRLAQGCTPQLPAAPPSTRPLTRRPPLPWLPPAMPQA